jgi:hypothetical protein
MSKINNNRASLAHLLKTKKTYGFMLIFYILFFIIQAILMFVYFDDNSGENDSKVMIMIYMVSNVLFLLIRTISFFVVAKIGRGIPMPILAVV